MSGQPLTLSDDDFANDAPPGYRSQKDKEKYLPLMATLLGGTFVLQMILPAVISLILMPVMMFRTTSQGMPQYTKLAAWQETLWYPTVEGPGGGCKLSALDYAGKPLDRPAIELDMQPEWLLGDGEKLWAVSKNEVAEVFADGSRPVVMHPTRFLRDASKPFLYEGKLAIVDRDDGGPFTLFVLENGEWNLAATLDVPSFDRSSGGVEVVAEDNAPADALIPETAGQSSAPVAPPPVSPVGTTPWPGLPKTTESQIQVVEANGMEHVILAENSMFEHFTHLHHHAGLPENPEDAALPAPVDWTELDTKAWAFTATTVGESPAVLVARNSGKGGGELELYRLVDRDWQRTAFLDYALPGMSAELATCVTPDGGRTFAVVESMGGLTQDLLELTPDKISKVASLQSFLGIANPFSENYFWLQLLIQLPSQLLMVVMILASTWLMHRHRDPNYFKGRVPVEYASILLRCAAIFIDLVIIMGPVYAGWYIWYRQSDLTFAKFVGWLESDIPALKAFFWDLLPWLIATVSWFFLWEIAKWLMISLYGCTIGKFLCGVRVTRTNLQPPGLLRGLIRNLLSWIELPMFNGIIGFALVAFLQNRQRLADLVAGTVVVKAGSLKAARTVIAVNENAM